MHNYILCDIFIPYEITINEIRISPETIREVSGILHYHIKTKKADLIAVYPYQGEVELYYDEESYLPLSEGTYFTVSLEMPYHDDWRDREDDILLQLMLEMEKDDLHIANHAQQICFIKDYD